MDSLRMAIEAVHQAMVDFPDPQIVAQLSQCLRQLTQIQQQVMQSEQEDPRAALLAQLQGATG